MAMICFLTYHLDADKKHGFEVKLAFAGLEQVLQGGAEQVHDHHVELLVGHRVVSSDVVQSGHTSCNENKVER